MEGSRDGSLCYSSDPAYPRNFFLAGKCPASSALWAGSRGTIRMKFHFREAPACGRRASQEQDDVIPVICRSETDDIRTFALFESGKEPMKALREKQKREKGEK